MASGAPRILSAAPSVNCAGAKVVPSLDVSALMIFRSCVSSLSESASGFTRSIVNVDEPFKTLRSNRTLRSRSTWRTRTCSGFEYECASRAISVFAAASADRKSFAPSVDEFRQAITNNPRRMVKQIRDRVTFILLLRKGRTNWQFARFSRKAAKKESRQSGPFALPSRRDSHSFREPERDLNASQKIPGYASLPARRVQSLAHLSKGGAQEAMRTRGPCSYEIVKAVP